MLNYRCHLARRLAVAAAAGLAAGLTACRAKPVLSPRAAPEPAIRACPAPRLRGVPWLFVEDSSGFILAMPPGFQERASGGAFRHFESPEGYGPWMSFGVLRGDVGLAGYRRVYQPNLMLDYSECTDTVGAYPVSIQAWRTPNGIFRNYQRFDRYDVFAIWEVRPGVYAHLSGGADQAQTQELMLAAIRSWKIQTPQ